MYIYVNEWTKWIRLETEWNTHTHTYTHSLSWYCQMYVGNDIPNVINCIQPYFSIQYTQSISQCLPKNFQRWWNYRFKPDSILCCLKCLYIFIGSTSLFNWLFPFSCLHSGHNWGTSMDILQHINKNTWILTYSET